MKKLIVIFGIIIMMLCAAISFPVTAESDDKGIFGRTHIRAIGSFAICEDEQVLYGHISIGLIGVRPVFNLDIEICEESIKRIVMGGISSTPDVYFYLNCVVKE